jgi:hypothetical protein
MAESPDAVISFLEDLSIRIRGKADEVVSTADMLHSQFMLKLVALKTFLEDSYDCSIFSRQNELLVIRV